MFDEYQPPRGLENPTRLGQRLCHIDDRAEQEGGDHCVETLAASVDGFGFAAQNFTGSGPSCASVLQPPTHVPVGLASERTIQ